MRKQKGQVIRIGDRWYVRYWESRNVGGVIERKRVTHFLGWVTTRGKRPPAEIEDAAAKYMVTMNSGNIPAEKIVTVGDFGEQVWLPWVQRYKRPSTAQACRVIWRNHLKPLAAEAWLKNVRTYDVQRWLNQISRSRNTVKHVKGRSAACSNWQNGRGSLMVRIQYATRRSIPKPPRPQKPTPTLWKKFRQSSTCYPNRRPRSSASPRSLVYGEARSRLFAGRTTAMDSYLFHGAFGGIT